MAENKQSSLKAYQPMEISCGHSTLFTMEKYVPSEVAGDFDDILGGQCSVSFLMVFLDTLVQLSVPVLFFSLL